MARYCLQLYKSWTVFTLPLRSPRYRGWAASRADARHWPSYFWTSSFADEKRPLRQRYRRGSSSVAMRQGRGNNGNVFLIARPQAFVGPSECSLGEKRDVVEQCPGRDPERTFLV